MACQHDRVYVRTFETGRVLWICRVCLKSAGEVDSGDPSRVFDTEEYFRLLEIFNNEARDRVRSQSSGSA